VIEDVHRRLEAAGIPFLERFATRDRILAEWSGRASNLGAGNPSRIVLAIILSARNRTDEARALHAKQARETTNPRHPEYVRALAAQLGLGTLDG
jgi:hypothetical protein